MQPKHDEHDFFKDLITIHNYIENIQQNSSFSAKDLDDVELMLKELEAKHGFRKNMSHFAENRYNIIMNQLFSAFYQQHPDRNPYSDNKTIHQFLKDEALAELLKQSPETARNYQTDKQIRDAVDNIVNKTINIASQYGFKAERSSIGNNINLKITINHQEYFLKITKKFGNCSQKAVFNLRRDEQLSSYFPKLAGYRKHMGTGHNFDAVFITEAATADIFSLGQKTTCEIEKLKLCKKIFLQMTRFFQEIYCLGITMEDGKGSNFGIDQEGNLLILDEKSIAYLSDIQTCRNEPSNTRLFNPVNSHLFMNKIRLEGEALQNRQSRLFAHFLGINLAVFLAGQTEDSLQQDMKNYNRDYKRPCPALFDFIKNQYLNKDSISVVLQPYYTLAEKLLDPIAPPSLDAVQLFLQPQTKKQNGPSAASSTDGQFNPPHTTRRKISLL